MNLSGFLNYEFLRMLLLFLHVFLIIVFISFMPSFIIFLSLKSSKLISLFRSKGEAQAMFLRHEGFLGALGAFMSYEKHGLDDLMVHQLVERFPMGAPYIGGRIHGPPLGDLNEKASIHTEFGIRDPYLPLFLKLMGCVEYFTVIIVFPASKSILFIIKPGSVSVLLTEKKSQEPFSRLFIMFLLFKITSSFFLSFYLLDSSLVQNGSRLTSK